MAEFQTEFQAGFERGRSWMGPNGDGSMGSLSAEFVREAAERMAAGHRFSELTDGPTAAEQAAAGAYMAGFAAGRSS